MKKVLSALLVLVILFSAVACFSSCSLLDRSGTYTFKKFEYKLLYDGKDVTNNIPEEAKDFFGDQDSIDEYIDYIVDELKDYDMVVDGDKIYPVDQPDESVSVKKSGKKLIPYNKDDQPLYDEDTGTGFYFLHFFNTLTTVMENVRTKDDHTFTVELNLIFEKPILPQFED